MLLSMTDEQMGNVLAALALHLTDRIREGVDEVAEHGYAAPPAVVIIWQHPGETIDFLRRILALTHSGTVRLVERLVDAGLIRKSQGGDARSVALTCTPLGAKRAKAILQARKSVVQPLISALSKADRKNLEAILRKVPWVGVSSKVEGMHTCRLCDINTCFMKGNCPVTVSRLSAVNVVPSLEGSRFVAARYDPADPDNQDR